MCVSIDRLPEFLPNPPDVSTEVAYWCVGEFINRFVCSESSFRSSGIVKSLVFTFCGSNVLTQFWTRCDCSRTKRRLPWMLTCDSFYWFTNVLLSSITSTRRCLMCACMISMPRITYSVSILFDLMSFSTCRSVLLAFISSCYCTLRGSLSGAAIRFDEPDLAVMNTGLWFFLLPSDLVSSAVGLLVSVDGWTGLFKIDSVICKFCCFSY